MCYATTHLGRREATASIDELHLLTQLVRLHEYILRGRDNFRRNLRTLSHDSSLIKGTCRLLSLGEDLVSPVWAY